MESKIIILEATFYRGTIRDPLSSESYWRPLSLENYWRPPFIGELLETPFHLRTIGDPLSSENYWRPPFIGELSVTPCHRRTIGDPLFIGDLLKTPFHRRTIGDPCHRRTIGDPFHRRTFGDPLWYINRSETQFPPDFSFRRKHVHLTTHRRSSFFHGRPSFQNTVVLIKCLDSNEKVWVIDINLGVFAEIRDLQYIKIWGH